MQAQAAEYSGYAGPFRCFLSRPAAAGSLLPAGDFRGLAERGISSTKCQQLREKLRVSNQKVPRCKRILTDKDRSSPLCEMRAGTNVPLAVRVTDASAGRLNTCLSCSAMR
jgi:hypothetical protein